jgi:hypothetical protein
VKYTVPQAPTYSSEDVLVLDGEQKGIALMVREKADDEVVAVSS